MRGDVAFRLHRVWIAGALLWSACGPPARSGESLLPAAMGAGWRRTSLRGSAGAKREAPRELEAVYEGAGKLTVDLYETKSSGTAFEMSQHWRSQPKTVVFDQGRYFAVVRWERAERQQLRAFVRALEKQLQD